MRTDDFILALAKMGYKQGTAILNEHTHLVMHYPPDEKSYITYRISSDESENDEWGIDVKTEETWKHFGYSPQVIFNTLNGHIDSYIYIDGQLEDQFLMPTGAEHIESIGDLCYLLEHTFKLAVEDYVRTTNANN